MQAFSIGGKGIEAWERMVVFMMDVLLLHEGRRASGTSQGSGAYVALQGFERLGSMAYFHFLPTGQFSILTRPSRTGLAFDIAFEIQPGRAGDAREIRSGRLAKLLMAVAGAEDGVGRIPFIYVDGFYLPMGMADIPEDALVEFAGKQDLSDIL